MTGRGVERLSWKRGAVERRAGLGDENEFCVYPFKD